MAFLSAPLLLIGNLMLPGHPIARTIRQGIRIYGWVLIRLVPFMAPVVLEDRSGGFEEPVIFTPNHSSSADPYLFGLVPVENAFVTSWPFHIPFYNFFMHLAGYVNSTRGWQHVQKKGRELLDSGCSLIIWPEGHRTRTGRLGRFKNGAFRLALATGRPIVPVCIIGSRRVLPPGRFFLSPARVRIILLPTITPAGKADNPEDIKNLKDKSKKCIDEELQKHRSSTAASAANRTSPLSFAVGPGKEPGRSCS
ncbi:MAG: lysophospholipid acyltransferase family protein [Desulfurivibrionaceae bacterium]|nr:lysophospholipid acyltransferase family protein [Desulfobulbales bacterium]MDT8334628.1 lysophospholipid acyltransferase family protein [Desulfurivibrionaceae bacterium]